MTCYLGEVEDIDVSARPSSPPSSSPLVATPPDVLNEDELSSTTTLETCYEEENECDGQYSGSSFLQTLDRRLLAVQQERKLSYSGTESLSLRNGLGRLVSPGASKSLSRSTTSARLRDGPLDTHPDALGLFDGTSLADTGAYTQSSVPRKRRLRSCSRSLRPGGADGCIGHLSVSSATYKKPKLSEAKPRGRSSLRRRTANQIVTGLSGAFKLRYSKGPGSLRRAESLRAELPATGAEERVVLNEVVEPRRSPLPSSKFSELSNAFHPREVPLIVGEATSPYGGNVPTEPTTPTSNDLSSPTRVHSPTLENLPIIAPPLFELIPRGPLSREDAAERRIAALLTREKAERDAEGLRPHSPPAMSRSEDEEKHFWASASRSPSDEYDTETDSNENASSILSRGAVNFNRALISHAPIESNVKSRLLEEVMNWFLEVMPEEDDHTTSYAPGDLFDLLSTSDETRFHAGYLFMRYFHLLRGSDDLELGEALETVTWDLAVACLALSIKFHRDVLFPLDVIYAEEFLQLAPHAMEFAELENAQRDVLEAVSYCIGSATPGAFMEEVWDALPTLRELVGFDRGWECAQDKAWDLLCDALQQQDLLRFPVSVLTAVAIMEGVLDVLVKRYKSTGKDRRGKPCKRDPGSLKKAAMKSSRGVRMDIQDVLHVSDGELLACKKWLGVD